MALHNLNTNRPGDRLGCPSRAPWEPDTATFRALFRQRRAALLAACDWHRWGARRAQNREAMLLRLQENRRGLAALRELRRVALGGAA